MASTSGFAGIVLAGGAGSRLGGRDKPAIRLAGRSLLDRTLEAASEAESLVVVGPRRPTTRPVRWTREQPEGSGPVAALSAGLAALPSVASLVAVLAADHPWLSRDTLRRLLEACRAVPDSGGAMLVDPGDRPQWLVGVWWVEPLRGAVPARPQNVALRDVLNRLRPLRVPAAPGEASDVDTPQDLRRALREMR
ncbi:Molybdopterin-guanine dinucleotide biosynthesis protein A [Actinopolyspora xinjiangensis]|uniref:Molybdopterin-guanine dinucleotide biosynthesis protein A n=1 Tax=Actinopolyspora xinjiangensis TaxID=405564 RepID=A0A1H0WT83_9ACTN|nr:nucleotidyltransferase family protein [Actinopolyspora xinjiangensis]SDP93800.1 Molybdopterin-guanine dinucleotide biosynthesis protein A [Actinopolyspora xinjiangensis]